MFSIQIVGYQYAMHMTIHFVFTAKVQIIIDMEYFFFFFFSLFLFLVVCSLFINLLRYNNYLGGYYGFCIYDASLWDAVFKFLNVMALHLRLVPCYE